MDQPVPGHDRRFVNDRGGDDHAIRWIAVVPIQFGRGHRYRWREIEKHNPFDCQCNVHPVRSGIVEIDAASLCVHGDFPATDRRDANSVGCLDGLPSTTGETAAFFGPPPDPRVGIKNDQSLFASQSSGSAIGLTMSPSTRTLPFNVRGASTGASLATGFPRLVTMISCPVSATSSRRAKQRVLNSAAAILWGLYMVT